MKHYSGLDVLVKETSICIVDETGRICREIKAVSHPDDLVAVLRDPAWNLDRIGLEAGPLSQWLFDGLAVAGLPVICIETRHTNAFLKAQPNKSDRNDARGIAQMMRVNLFRPVHVKTLISQKRRALLTARKLLQGKAIAIVVLSNITATECELDPATDARRLMHAGSDHGFARNGRKNAMY